MTLLAYFNANDWGTVSDWCMVIVTIVTAYYLYKTLQSQKQVQQTQNDLFRIEGIRFRESIKPVLKYQAVVDMFKPSDDQQKVLTVKVTNETSNTALEISKVVAEGKLSHQIFIPLGYDDRRNHLAIGDNPLLFHFLIEENSHDLVGFVVRYKDVSGTTYKQSVLCICDKMGTEIHPMLPAITD